MRSLACVLIAFRPAGHGSVRHCRRHWLLRFRAFADDEPPHNCPGLRIGGANALLSNGVLHTRRPRRSLRGGIGWINSRPDRVCPSCAARSSCSISGRSAASIATTFSPTWPSSRKNIKTSLSSSASIPAKFDAERDTENIRRKVAEYRIKHPVINDAQDDALESFGVNSWPTLVLIDAHGITGGHDRAARGTMTCSTRRSASSSRPPRPGVI